MTDIVSEEAGGGVFNISEGARLRVRQPGDGESVDEWTDMGPVVGMDVSIDNDGNNESNSLHFGNPAMDVSANGWISMNDFRDLWEGGETRSGTINTTADPEWQERIRNYIFHDPQPPTEYPRRWDMNFTHRPPVVRARRPDPNCKNRAAYRRRLREYERSQEVRFDFRNMQMTERFNNPPQIRLETPLPDTADAMRYAMQAHTHITA